MIEQPQVVELPDYKHRVIEGIHETLKHHQNIMQLCIDSLEAHGIADIAHIREVLLVVADEAYESQKQADALRKVLYQEFLNERKGGAQ